MGNMVHVSFDLVDKFVPRVPKNRLADEDAKKKRICVAPDIRSALQAIPWCGKVISAMKELGLPVIIHAYYMDSKKVVPNSEVQKYVADAHLTGEMWITRKPDKVLRRDYELYDTDIFSRLDDRYGTYEIILNTQMKRVKNQDNWQNFLIASCSDGGDVERLNRIKAICNFRKFMLSLSDEQIEELKERIQENEGITDIQADTGSA